MSQFTQPPQSPQPQQPYAPAQMPGVRPARNGLGIAALVLGVIGAVSGLIPFLFWMAGILGLIALILGLAGRGRAKRGEATNKGMTTFGAALGLIALILAVVGAVITFKAVGDAVDDLNKAVSDTTASAKPKPGGDSAKGGGADKKGDADKKKETGEALEAGDSAVYDDDLTVTVGDATSYTPDAYAAGHTKGKKAYRVAVVIENAGKEKFDSALVSVSARAGQDGVDAEQIFDNKVGAGFSGTVLPGKKVTVQFAFDAPADAKNLTVEVNPGFTYDASQWDLKL
ncbi:DUF4352 domain-containing protein [Streptomyces sp. JV185]|uniref:DUF4352 domain-containing protein n=1 Tax=Streptomyces sp. JV185 TaxID=858638 RepID=UPI002E78858C|nr:DUF4352 domain-containing protein [Streptomyces sp. JV185]MEE1768820.1 DUF4352 domain-containing protein [Streptomyces sp. JV185]